MTSTGTSLPRPPLFACLRRRVSDHVHATLPSQWPRSVSLSSGAVLALVAFRKPGRWAHEGGSVTATVFCATMEVPRAMKFNQPWLPAVSETFALSTGLWHVGDNPSQSLSFRLQSVTCLSAFLRLINLEYRYTCLDQQQISCPTANHSSSCVTSTTSALAPPPCDLGASSVLQTKNPHHCSTVDAVCGTQQTYFTSSHHLIRTAVAYLIVALRALYTVVNHAIYEESSGLTSVSLPTTGHPG